MTRRSRILVLLYALHALWSAWCATQQAFYGNVLVATVFVLFSVVPVAAVLEQSELTDLRDAVHYYKSREARRRSRDAHEAQLKAAGLQRAD
ncbi:hypothetical protein [Streptomyces sp. NPDC088794]|uniref:hypothetical protein n=1 Tax=Streptomyces sp. NPDC088794 TaxID=3365902 RepID=UPI00381BBA0E